MNTIQQICLYLAIGFLWAGVIEYTTTKWKVGGEWSNGERIVQATLWPIFFLKFVVAFWISFFGMDNDDTNDY
jgi:hypothetical protein